MGFSIRDIVILYWLKSNHLLAQGDSVAELGSQQINNDVLQNLDHLEVLAKLFKVAPFKESFDWKLGEQKYLASGMQELPRHAPLAQKVYEHLGFKYACIDLDQNPHSIKMDLNFDSVPKRHRGKYALVTNLGTTEHVLNQLNAFKMIHDLTAPKGIMVHTLPFQGFATHGLVNYTMKFFWLLCRYNMYRVIDADISAWQRTPLPASVVEYIKKTPTVFTSKEHVDKLEQQDTGITVILQKEQNIDFVPPIDLVDDCGACDQTINERYWTGLAQNTTRGKILRIKTFLKKIFRSF